MFDYLSKKMSSLIETLTTEKKLSEKIVENFLHELKCILIDADVPLEAIEDFLTDIKSKSIGIELKGGVTSKEMLTKNVYDSLVSFLGGSLQHSKDLLISKLSKAQGQKELSVILVAGLQGAGKTTTLTKLAFHYAHEQKKVNAKIFDKIMLASVDYTRPAARDQLRILSEKNNLYYYESLEKSPLNALKDILAFAKKENRTFVFLDTAGRLHIDENLLDELRSIYDASKPVISLLVLDGMIGQAALTVAKHFSKAIDFDGAVLTKMDSESRAGASFSFSHITKKPVLYIGTGEKIDELDVFRPERIAGRILGKGDIESLIENANQKIAKAEETMIMEAAKRGDLSIDGYINVLDIIDRMGSWKKLFSMMPRTMLPPDIKDDHITQMDKDARMFRAMASSMTSKERTKPAILSDISRIKRIASGSGILIADVQRLLKHYHQMKDQMKMIGKMGRFFT